jgi:hypothetical protein
MGRDLHRVPVSSHDDAGRKLMLFRYVLIVSQVAMSRPDPIRVQYSASPLINVEIARDTDESRSVCVTAIRRYDSHRHDEVFRALEAGKLPVDAQPYMTGDGLVQPGESLGKWVPDPDVLPEGFQSLTQQMARELNDAAKRTWRLLHWRFNVDASRGRLSSRGMQWSWNGDVWHAVPIGLSGVATVRRGVPGDPTAGAEVEVLLGAGLVAPLAYDLLQESIDLSASNPRAALVAVITALEVGIKTFITELAPHAEWLVQEVPSPPVVRMLKEYIPKLPARLQIAGKVVAPPDRVLERIRDGVSKRDQLVHRGAETVDGQFLKEVTEAVSDCLRLLDYYAGQAWALKWLTLETMEDLGLRTTSGPS